MRRKKILFRSEECKHFNSLCEIEMPADKVLSERIF